WSSDVCSSDLLILYDSTRTETQRVRSDYAIQHVNTGITELRKNVVATRADGMTLKSEELIWNENERRLYSNLPVEITVNDQVSSGTSFWAREDLSYFESTSHTGDFRFNSDDRLSLFLYTTVRFEAIFLFYLFKFLHLIVSCARICKICILIRLNIRSKLIDKLN